MGDTSLQITKMTTARSARSALSFLLPTLHSGLFCHQLSGNSRSLFFSAVSKETVFHLSPSVNLKSNETVDRWLHVACYGALPFLQGKHEGSPDKNWQMKKVLNDKYYEMYRDRLKGVQILLSRTQARPGRTVKQEQEEISRNHVQAFIPGFVFQYRTSLTNAPLPA